MEELKHIQLVLDYYDENLKKVDKTFTVKVNKLKNISIKGFTTDVKKYSLSFSLTLPNEIHSTIVGKSIPKRGISSNRNEFNNYPNDFPKTVTSFTIENLCDKYIDILNDFYWLKSIDQKKLVKTIFFKFNAISKKVTSQWNGIELGDKCEIEFDYFIGYKSNDGLTMYNQNQQLIHHNYDSSFYKFDSVIWTQEREDFFNNTNKSFIRFIEIINKFKESLTNEGIDSIINTQQTLLT